MLETERTKLREAAENQKYMSIAVNADGTPVKGCFIPWSRTVSAFNMETPKVTLSADDLRDAEIVGDLKKCDLVGLYLFTPLPAYDWIAEYKGVRDLFICHGENIRNLHFVSDLPELFMFYLEDADIRDLSPLIDNLNRGDDLPGKCLGFCRCCVKNTEALSKAEFLISELLVWPVEGDKRDRWNITKRHPGVFKFYEQD